MMYIKGPKKQMIKYKFNTKKKKTLMLRKVSIVL